MKNQPIYRTVFNQLHENGTLDRVKDSVIAANVKFPEDTDYDFA